MLPTNPLETDGPALQHLGKTRPKPARLHRGGRQPSVKPSIPSVEEATDAPFEEQHLERSSTPQTELDKPVEKPQEELEEKPAEKLEEKPAEEKPAPVKPAEQLEEGSAERQSAETEEESREQPSQEKLKEQADEDKLKEKPEESEEKEESRETSRQEEVQNGPVVAVEEDEKRVPSPEMKLQASSPPPEIPRM